MILEVFPSGPIETNSYLLVCEETKKAWVVDAPLGCLDEISAQCNRERLQVEKIILTHSHWDHIAEVAALQKAFSCTVYVHREDAANVQSPGSDGLPLYFSIEGISDVSYLEEGQILSLGHLEALVIHTPGHSPGGVCLYFSKEEILISGDTLFQGSMGRVDLATSEPERMWESLRKLSALPSHVKVFPGHGRSTTIGAESWMAKAKDHFS